MISKTAIALVISSGLIYGLLNYEPEMIPIDYSDYYALANGHEADRKLARSIMLYVWYRTAKQCRNHDKALYELNGMTIPVNCAVRNKYFALPTHKQQAFAANELP